jgi:hypothetical protein
MAATDGLLAGRRRRAERLANTLHIPLFLRADGEIARFPPGERIEPSPRALPTSHWHEPQPEERYE